MSAPDRRAMLDRADKALWFGGNARFSAWLAGRLPGAEAGQ